ncbi:MAG TPA: HAMP domain-containing sensor histidine kinase [Bacteroidia bacterium]|nr:HAMP domain-containing sensor histidine kinase [Bacteroidia bacterium]
MQCLFLRQMKPKPYQLIIGLLCVSITGVLLLQVFWMKRYYDQKKRELDKQVQEVLANTAARLLERENIQVIKHSFDQDSNAYAGSISTKIIVHHTSSKPVMPAPPPPVAAPPVAPPDPPRALKAPIPPEAKQALEWKDETLILDSLPGSSALSRVVIRSNDLDTARQVELKKLLYKMEKEIRDIETSSIDKISEAQLRGILREELYQAGLNTPFEFCLRRNRFQKDTIIACSRAFDSAAASYSRDLSAGQVIPRHTRLYLQLPFNTGIWSGLNKLVWISLVFTLLILIVFYFSIHLLLRQKKLGELKNDFINNMTHELNTPIATIALATEALAHPLTRQDEVKYNTYTQVLREENKKLKQHVERVLQMALMDRGELRLHKEKLNLVDLIRAVNEAYALQCAEKKASLVFEPESESLTLEADAFHLRNMLSNLLDNALKYSGEGPRIEWTLEEEQEALIIRIKDQGIGIASENREKVFGRFFREEGGDLHHVKGFGLGLSYVKAIVEAHGGEISLSSEKGKGSVFTLKFKTHA